MSKGYRIARIGSIALAVGLIGCSEQRLGGEIEVNGRKGSVTACRVSPPGGEKWAEVSTDTGVRIRIAQRPTADASAKKTDTIIEIAQPRSASFAEARCKVKLSSSTTINGRTSGSVTLTSCVVDGMAVSGKFTYGQCTQGGAFQRTDASPPPSLVSRRASAPHQTRVRL